VERWVLRVHSNFITSDSEVLAYQKQELETWKARLDLNIALSSSPTKRRYLLSAQTSNPEHKEITWRQAGNPMVWRGG